MCVCQVLAICRDLKCEHCTCLLYYNSLCLYGFGLWREVRVKTEKIWSGPGTRTQTILHIHMHTLSNWHLSNLMYSKWCLKMLSRSEHGASWSSSVPSTSSPSGSLHQQATYSSFSIHPSVFSFPSLHLCLSSLKPSLPHLLSIMLLSCSDSALFFHFFLLFLYFTLIALPVAEDDVCRLVILTLIC